MSAPHPELAQHLRPTTLLRPQRLLDRLGLDLTIASETFQHTGSFKFRAAMNMALSVEHPGIITASSGNFGQAISYACKLVGKQCIVVMPSTSAEVKVEAVREHGATAELTDVNSVSRATRVEQVAAEHPDFYVASAYDDQLVVSGNATLGDELLEHGFDTIIAPVGGGGLSSGIAQALEDSGSCAMLYGAEPLMANDAARSFREGQHIVDSVEAQTIADGARTLGLGLLNYEILLRRMEAIVEVPEEKIKEALQLYFLFANLKVEPTGALTLGALLTEADGFRDKKVCVLASGGNVDPKVFSQVLLGKS